jgi:hypothetical protein
MDMFLKQQLLDWWIECIRSELVEPDCRHCGVKSFAEVVGSADNSFKSSKWLDGYTACKEKQLSITRTLDFQCAAFGYYLMYLTWMQRPLEAHDLEIKREKQFRDTDTDLASVWLIGNVFKEEWL